MKVQRRKYANFFVPSEELQRVLSYQRELQNEGRKPHTQTREQRDAKPLLKWLRNRASSSQALNTELPRYLSSHLPLQCLRLTCWLRVLPCSQPGQHTLKQQWDAPWSLKQENAPGAELHWGATSLELEGAFFRYGPASRPDTPASPSPIRWTPWCQGSHESAIVSAMRTTQPCPRHETWCSHDCRALARWHLHTQRFYRGALVWGWRKALPRQRTTTPTPAQPYKTHLQEMNESIQCCDKLHLF